MYRLALIQNQSEMSHYGYADARAHIVHLSFNYDIALFTAENIHSLASDLASAHIDAVMFASNALNDKTIRQEVFSESFAIALSKLLSRGGGCLVLHQLRLAEEGRDQENQGFLSFLPGELGTVKAVARASGEKAEDGRIARTLTTDSHACFRYPAPVSIKKLTKELLGYKSLRGLYWHYWNNTPATNWDTLLIDSTFDRATRNLFLVTKGADNQRVVLCSLTIDWQKQEDLFRNVLMYVVEGQHSTAIIRHPSQLHFSFEYLISRLQSRKFPFRLYDSELELAEAAENVKSGIHSIVLLGPYLGDPSAKEYSDFHDAAGTGKIKLVTMDAGKLANRRFTVEGRERYAKRLLLETEMKVQAELLLGYVDHSFWATVESLQTLGQISSTWLKNSELVSTALKLAEGHEHNWDGSYDQVFGATCALLWLRAVYLGAKAPETLRSKKWVEERFSSYEAREQALAHRVFVETGFRPSSIDELRALLSGLNEHGLSEIDLVEYLQASILVGDQSVVARLVVELGQRQVQGCWIDIATTASAMSALLKARTELLTARRTSIVSKLDGWLFAALTYIQDAIYDISEEEILYPWDNKASTSLKCIHAWLQFEDLIEMPVHELIDSISSYAARERVIDMDKKSLAVLRVLGDENKSLSDKVRELENSLSSASSFQKDAADARSAYEEADKQKRIWRGLWLLTFPVAVYFTTTVIIYMFSGAKDSDGIKKAFAIIFREAFGQNWLPHVAILTLVMTAIGVLIAVRKRAG